jgi:hypothetical protein
MAPFADHIRESFGLREEFFEGFNQVWNGELAYPYQENPLVGFFN